MIFDPRIIEQFDKRAPFKFNDGTLLVLATVGSHSTNTNLPDNDPLSSGDHDYMGVIIPPVEYVLGLEKKWESLQFQHEDIDCIFYSFHHYMELVRKNNPNVLGLMWLRPDFYVYESYEWNAYMIPNRSVFSTIKAYEAFMGYAVSQLSKMERFTPERQAEYEAAISFITSLGFTEEQILKRQSHPFKEPVDIIQYTKFHDARTIIVTTHARFFHAYMGEKRRELVRKFGYDTRNASHLIRLMTMLCDYLLTGQVEVYREHDGDYFRAIKRGDFSLEHIKQLADSLEKRASEYRDRATLPTQFNTPEANKIMVQIYQETFSQNSL